MTPVELMKWINKRIKVWLIFSLVIIGYGLLFILLGIVCKETGLIICGIVFICISTPFIIFLIRYIQKKSPKNFGKVLSEMNKKETGSKTKEGFLNPDIEVDKTFATTKVKLWINFQNKQFQFAFNNEKTKVFNIYEITKFEKSIDNKEVIFYTDDLNYSYIRMNFGINKDKVEELARIMYLLPQKTDEEK